MAKKLGELLVDKGVITKEQLEVALNECKRTDEFLGRALINLKLISEDQFLQVLSEQMRIPYIDLSKVQIQEDVLKRVSGKLVWDYEFIPIRLKKDTLTIAISNPHDAMVLDKIRSMIGLKLELNLAKESEIKNLIKKHYTSLADMIEKLLSVEE